jgi:hypothetical protein
MDAVIQIVYEIIKNTLYYVAMFAQWFYLTFLPFVIQYIGIPFFVLGILLALSFAGGTIVFAIVFFVFMFYFIKGTIFAPATHNQ